MRSKPVFQMSSIILMLLSLLFVLYAGDKSLVIANAGVTDGVPQLTGDGGAGLLCSALCLIAAGLGLWLRGTSAIFYVIAFIVILAGGVVYQDNGMFIWTIPPLLFAVGELTLKRLSGRTRTSEATSRQRQRKAKGS